MYQPGIAKKIVNVLELYRDDSGYNRLSRSIAKYRTFELLSNWTPQVRYISSMGLDAIQSLAACSCSLDSADTLPVSVASCEHAFRKFYLRPIMSHERLRNLSASSIGKEGAAFINFGKVLKDFTAIKARNVLL